MVLYWLTCVPFPRWCPGARLISVHEKWWSLAAAPVWGGGHHNDIIWGAGEAVPGARSSLTACSDLCTMDTGGGELDPDAHIQTEYLRSVMRFTQPLGYLAVSSQAPRLTADSWWQLPSAGCRRGSQCQLGNHSRWGNRLTWGWQGERPWTLEQWICWQSISLLCLVSSAQARRGEARADVNIDIWDNVCPERGGGQQLNILIT